MLDFLCKVEVEFWGYPYVGLLEKHAGFADVANLSCQNGYIFCISASSSIHTALHSKFSRKVSFTKEAGKWYPCWMTFCSHAAAESSAAVSASLWAVAASIQQQSTNLNDWLNTTPTLMLCATWQLVWCNMSMKEPEK